MQKTEIIEVKQLPVIVEQLQIIKEEVTAKVSEALSLECTEDTVQAVKKVRAELNADLKYWEDKRKYVKNAIMNPYNQFEVIYKDCISEPYKMANTELKDKIDEVENALKEQKHKEVSDYFNELCEANGIDFLSFDKANINITLSASKKSLKDQARAFVERVCDDLKLIDTQEHKEEILYEYKRFLNVSLAITTVSMRYKAIEEERTREAERKAREEATRAAAEKVAEIAETLIPPTVVPPDDRGGQILTLKFTVKGTREKLKTLKEFLMSNNYDFE